jgi:tetratricopeptide (TPR) repeat protein
MRRAARAACAIGWLVLAGCAAPGPRHDVIGRIEPGQVELAATPFFPQSDYQCGPAALATVLAASNVEVTPEELVPEVYLPARRGSLQIELIAATRIRGRLPYVLAPEETALFAELAAGRPLLVLQKLGAGPWPGWHYAVLIGYDRDRETVVLRSGTKRRVEMSLRRFLWSWDRGGRWALLTLEPGDLPATADLHRYVDAAAGLEAAGRLDTAALAYQSATHRWPDAALPWLGLGNVSYAREELRAAQAQYREAIVRDPQDVAARNNRADTLLRLGCPEAAAHEIARAQEAARGGAFEAAVAETAQRVAAAGAAQPDDCPIPSDGL